MSTEENLNAENEKIEEQNQPVAETVQDGLSDDQKKIAELEQKVNELNDKYLRLYSEYDNFRKRTAKERIELMKTAGEDIFKSFLPIVDDFERALQSINTASDVKAIAEGVDLIYNKMKSSLQQKGLEEMKAVGEDFNSDLHEAITNVPAPSELLKGKVIDELEKGYYLNGKIIRFAKVVIGS